MEESISVLTYSYSMPAFLFATIRAVGNSTQQLFDKSNAVTLLHSMLDLHCLRVRRL